MIYPSENRRPRVIVLALALIAAALAASACKTSLRKDYANHYGGRHLERPADDERPLLGIVVPAKDGATSPGVPIARVLRESPADDAGIRAGDLLVRIGALAVNAPADIAGAMKPGGPVKATSHLDLTVIRDGEKIVLTANMRSRDEYLDVARRRWESHMNDTASTFAIPFLFDYQRREIDPATWLDYSGTRVKEPVVMYRDVDFVPLLGLFSLFRLESMPVIDTWRMQVTVWPAVFTSSGKAETYFDAIEEEGEDAYERL